ncbi:MAG: slipin family protein [Thermoleophilia bacterium]
MTALIVILLILIILGFFLTNTVQIADEYERGVLFRLGRYAGIRGPGLFITIPLVDRAARVDLRTVTLNIPPQEVITKDNVTVTVNAVAYFRVVDPKKAVIQVENYQVATSQMAQTTLRSIAGQADLDALLSDRDTINAELQKIIDAQTIGWGIKVAQVELKDVEVPQSMQRVIARQAEAERERRAKVIAADGELEASRALSQAARVIASQPSALQLRYLQTVTEVGTSENTKTLIVPFPVEMLGNGGGGTNGGGGSGGGPQTAGIPSAGAAFLPAIAAATAELTGETGTPQPEPPTKGAA